MKLQNSPYSSILCAIFAIMVFGACEGPPGRDGFNGINGVDGADGVNDVIGIAIDRVVDFGIQDNFAVTIQFPQEIEVFEEDIVLVYRLAETLSNGNNTPIDVWQALPQNFFLQEGILQYNYDYTFLNCSIFLDGNFDLNALGTAFTLQQIFRIVIMPADIINARDVFQDFTTLSYNQLETKLMKNYGTKLRHIP